MCSYNELKSLEEVQTLPSSSQELGDTVNRYIQWRQTTF
jgi:hypothetical protein